MSCLPWRLVGLGETLVEGRKVGLMLEHGIPEKQLFTAML